MAEHGTDPQRFAGLSAGAHPIILEHLQPRPAAKGWRSIPEFPTAEEINRYHPDKLPPNNVKEPWSSKEDYLETIYRILRCEGVEGLRHAVAQYKANPDMMDDKTTCVYTNVHVQGYLMTHMGAFCHIRFSARRAGVSIKWQQSRRLATGGVVAITTAADKFKSICKIAIVAQRPVNGGLDRNPPEIEIMWAKTEDAVFDPTEELVMVESRSGYYEAIRHALVGLQHAAIEPTVLDKYVVGAQTEMCAPQYIRESPILDISSIVHHPPPGAGSNLVYEIARAKDPFRGINVLDEIPADITSLSTMDRSQIDALVCMISQELAIVQGPPGTGKTFTSVSALNVLRANRRRKDPPIIVAAQTNHALDQMLVHCQSAGASIMRLGSRTESDMIAQRTMYNLKRLNSGITFKGFKAVDEARKTLVDGFMSKLKIAFPEGLLGSQILQDMGLLSSEQIASLSLDKDCSESESDSSQSTSSRPEFAWEDELRRWIGDEQLSQYDNRPQPDPEFANQEEGDDIGREFEYDTGMDGSGPDEEDLVRGTWAPILATIMGKPRRAKKGDEQKTPEKLLKTHDDLWEIPQYLRGSVYRHIQNAVLREKKNELTEILRQWDRVCRDHTAQKWTSNMKLVPTHRIEIIGCTTTGLAKYRGLLSAIQPNVLLIEEAAETREANIVSALYPSLQQLILVGDHKQLTPKCDVHALSGEPYYINMSLFERLVGLRLPFSQLTQQRRMKPEIRGLLNHFYDNLTDHPLVTDKEQRPDVPGMGGKNMWFFHHEWPEDVDADCSKYNEEEAAMIAKFYLYLFNNGVDPSLITVLTYYKGQRKVLLRKLRGEPLIRHLSFNVFTVDSYQGEENDIILLSLVRSPKPDANYLVGFLADKNRATVAISRARCGFYIFGNLVNALSATYESYNVWGNVQHHFAKAKCFGKQELPITCQPHGTRVFMTDPESFIGNAGGCRVNCGGRYTCGHNCRLTCHWRPHEDYVCKEPCTRELPCGHGCSNTCMQKCCCAECHFQQQASSVEDPQPVQAVLAVRPLEMLARVASPPAHKDEAETKTEHWEHFVRHTKMYDRRDDQKATTTNLDGRAKVFRMEETFKKTTLVDGRRTTGTAPPVSYAAAAVSGAVSSTTAVSAAVSSTPSGPIAVNPPVLIDFVGESAPKGKVQKPAQPLPAVVGPGGRPGFRGTDKKRGEAEKGQAEKGQAAKGETTAPKLEQSGPGEERLLDL